MPANPAWGRGRIWRQALVRAVVLGAAVAGLALLFYLSLRQAVLLGAAAAAAGAALRLTSRTRM